MRDGRDGSGFITLEDGNDGPVRLEVRRIAARDPARPTLVFLHEGLGCVALWKDFPDRIAEATGCGVVIYSRAGYGASSPVDLPRPLRYMHDEALETLPRLLDALALEDVVLVGHSDGGSIALIHAGGAGQGDKARLRGVVSMAAHAFNEELSVTSIAQARDAYEQTDLRARLARLHGENVDIAFWGWNRAWLDPGFRDWSIEEYLPGITVPVLVIQGLDDEYGTGDQVAAIARGVGDGPGPGAQVCLLDDCRHSPHRDQPERTITRIAEFIAGL